MQPELIRTGASLNRGGSKQDYGTPPDFLEAVGARFGRIIVDLAASRENSVVPEFYDEDADSLAQDWTLLRGNLWLNPPFANITPWARKCAESASPTRRILFLTPASVGSEWFDKYVRPHAVVLALRPRLTFVGCKDPYPRDLILSVYGLGVTGFDCWRWK